MYIQTMTKQTLSFRIDAVILERLRRLTLDSQDPYAPTMTQVVERGIELAIKELERKKDR